jgi:hypothetical protein
MMSSTTWAGVTWLSGLMGSSVLLSLATVLVGFGFATVLVLGRKVSNSLVAQPA